MHSLSRRLLLSISVPLVLFFGVTIAVLDSNFRDLSRRALREMLEAQVVALIAAAEPQADGTFAPLPRALDSRLATAGSGLYAQIRVAGRRAVWRSPSTAGAFINFGPMLRPGEPRFSQDLLPDGTSIAVLSRGISFEAEEDSGATVDLTFDVATSLAPYEAQLSSFRRQLFGWFAGLTLLLLAILAVLLRWVLAPVRRLEQEIYAVEEGERETLSERYPRELAGVAGNLNTLLRSERKRVARYRNMLGNLAHSLKTPLAILRSNCQSSAEINTQIDRMTGIIEHQLKRATASGSAALGQAPVEVAPIAEELRVALLKAHRNKDLSIEISVDSHARFAGDKADITELLGNLIDNACKWCQGVVRLSARLNPQAPLQHRLELVVEDDGPGISAEDRQRVFERGTRTDENVPGHGLGLAIVRDMVELYGGNLTLDQSKWGGARIRVQLPGR